VAETEAGSRRTLTVDSAGSEAAVVVVGVGEDAERAGGFGLVEVAAEAPSYRRTMPLQAPRSTS
jgi:hypothetical protein